MKDELFKQTQNEPKKFDFDENVSAVFDDMINRSIPFYMQSQELAIYFLNQYLEQGDKVYDLGCSTNNFLLLLECKNPHLELFGIDNSSAMLKEAQKKCTALNSKIQLHQSDLTTLDFYAKAATLNYVLQFIRPREREVFVQNLYSKIEPDGVVIFTEKTISSNCVYEKMAIEKYYEFKKSQGYSNYEIMKKREALENILIPYTQDENIQMFKEAGFKYVDVIFKWVNFALFIASK